MYRFINVFDINLYFRMDSQSDKRTKLKVARMHYFCYHYQVYQQKILTLVLLQPLQPKFGNFLLIKSVMILTPVQLGSKVLVYLGEKSVANMVYFPHPLQYTQARFVQFSKHILFVFQLPICFNWSAVCIRRDIHCALIHISHLRSVRDRT